MRITPQQRKMLKGIVTHAINALGRLGWVRGFTFTDEKGNYVSVVDRDPTRRKACSIVGALMVGLEKIDIGKEYYILDMAIEAVQTCLPKEYQQPYGIYDWNRHACKSRKECLAVLQKVLKSLEA